MYISLKEICQYRFLSHGFNFKMFQMSANQRSSLDIQNTQNTSLWFYDFIKFWEISLALQNFRTSLIL
jgi:hypothetical protein